MPDLTTEQIAEHYQVHPETIQIYLRDGRFPGAYKLGRQWRIPPESLDALRPDTTSIIPPRNARSRAQQRRTA